MTKLIVTFLNFANASKNQKNVEDKKYFEVLFLYSPVFDLTAFKLNKIGARCRFANLLRCVAYYKGIICFLGNKNVQTEARFCGSCLLKEAVSVLCVQRKDLCRKQDRRISKYLAED
jgi:hypothetical protein